MSALPGLIALAGALVAIQLLLARRRARRSGHVLLPVPKQPLPDTRTALFVCLLLWVFAQFLLPFLLMSPNRAPPDGLTLFLAGGVVHLGLALLFWTSARHDAGVAMPRARVYALGVGLGFVAFSAVQGTGWALQVVDSWIGRETPSQDAVNLVRDGVGLELAITVVLAVGVAPLAEEVFFRGLMLPAFARVMPIGLAIAAQAACFGMSHVIGRPEQWPLAIPLAVVGWLCGRAYVRTRSLGSAVLLHAVFNGLQVVLMRIVP